MPYTEIVIPHIKPDSASWDGFRKGFPVSSAVLQSQNSFQGGFYGFVVEEDGKAVKNDFRFVLYQGWSSYAEFHAFLASPDLGAFLAPIQPFFATVEKPEMYETTAKPVESTQAPLKQIVRTSVAGSGGGALAEAEKVWKGLVSTIEGAGADAPLMLNVMHGKSAHSYGGMYLGVIGWSDNEARKSNQDAVEEAVDQLRKLGDTSVLVANFVDINTPIAEFSSFQQ